MLSPNPAGSEVKVNLSEFEGRAASLEVFNQLGARVWFTNFDEVNTPVFTLILDKSTFANGVYTVSLTSGDQRVTKKLVVQMEN